MLEKLKYSLLLIAILTVSFLFAKCNRSGVEEYQKPDFDSSAVFVNDTLAWDYNPSNGWMISTPSQQDMDSSILVKANKLVSRISGFHSFLIVRNGYLVFEKYYSGFNKDNLNNLKSATKSVTSILIGIALRENLIEDVDQTMYEIFPEYYTEDVDTVKRIITLKHLLTMTAGFKWNNFGGSIRNQWWNHQSNPNKYAITVPKLIHTPGLVFNYNSSLSHLLGGTVVKKSGLTLFKFATLHLFNPLGINDIKWKTDNTGLHRGHSELWMTSRDMAKIGYLYLKNGFWFNNHIVSENWVRESLKAYIDGTGIWARYGSYGYQWWSRIINGTHVYFAAGYGGQFIFIIPKLDLVIVTTTKWYSSRNSFIPIDIVRDYILPSIRKVNNSK
jgi:CubicO group peptidase (beta-lactamase class C family)